MVDFKTEKNWKDFKKAYDEAVEKKVEVFVYHNQDVVTNFAKYLIQHHEQIRK